MSFLVYDIIFLAIFLVFFSVFLYTRKRNLKRDGLLFLYRTQWGVRLINYLGKKYQKTLSVLSYVSIFTGYLLLAGILYLIYSIMKIYVFNPEIVRAIKVPPIIPLVPYLPQVFQLEFLPPFYFTYWIVILAVIAISHEMAHGIFMRRYNIKIKSTGFAFFPYFFPIFPAAFVEQEETSMKKAKKFHQMAALSAGTFANVITAIIFFIILFGFFSLAFSPSGVIFDSYATAAVVIPGISSVNGIAVNNLSYTELNDRINEEGFNNLTFAGHNYILTKSVLESQEDNEGIILAYSDAPAISENLSRIITEINNVPVYSIDDLQQELEKYSPGDSITVTTKTDEAFADTTIILGEHPERPGNPWLGIGFLNQRSGIISGIVSALAFKEPNTYYEPKIAGISVFFYNLLWWIVIISISVALINMLPMGIFDGGRFFYLTVLGITKNEKFARNAFSFMTYFFLFLLLILMISWAFRIF